MIPAPSVFGTACAVLVLIGASVAPGQPKPAEPSTREQVYRVKVSGLGYHPPTLTVHVGDRITWLNDDLIVHTVTAADRSFDSGDLAGGQSWTWIARRRGTFVYACRYHPNMQGKLIIQ